MRVNEKKAFKEFEFNFTAILFSPYPKLVVGYLPSLANGRAARTPRRRKATAQECRQMTQTRWLVSRSRNASCCSI
jgi:hypothetical protein